MQRLIKWINKYIPFLAVIFILLLSFSGCGNTQYGNHAGEKDVVDYQFIDWKTQPILISEIVDTSTSMSASDYFSLKNEDKKTFTKYYTDENTFYESYYYEGTEGVKTYIRSYQVDSGLENKKECELAKMEEWTNWIIADMQFHNGKMNALMYTYKDGEESYQLVSENEEGEFLTEADLSKLYKEEKIAKGKYVLAGECILDSKGYSYTRNMDNKCEIIIADSNGTLAMKKEYTETGCTIGDPIQGDDSPMIFPIYTYSGCKLVWFEPEKKEEHLLTELSKGDCVKFHTIHKNNIYYESKEGIVKWDVVNGERKQLFTFSEYGIPKNTKLYLAFDQNDILYIRYISSREDGVYKVENEITSRDEVRIVNLCDDSDIVKSVAAVASRTNPQYRYVYEKAAENEFENYRTSILAEMVEGNGPDILFVSGDDLKVLYEKGITANLDEFISSPMRESLYSGVIKMGTMNQTFVGLAPEIYANTIFVSDSLWTEENWALDDIMKLAEVDNTKGIFSYMQARANYAVLLNCLVEMNLSHSQFIDWEQKESRFEQEQFIKVLELIKKFDPDKSNYGNDEIIDMIGKGEYLGVILWVPNISFFTQGLQILGENIHCIGYPNEGGNGNYLYSDGFIIVNSKTKQKEAVKKYIEKLLSKECQNDFIEKISPIKYSLEVWESEDRLFSKYGALDLKEDGSTYIDDFETFMESCVPVTERYNDICSIIEEEAGSYFCGDRSAKETAEIIDNRVQLYLDEKNRVLY